MASTEPIATVVVEDERLAREELLALLQGYPCLDVVGTAADVAGARALIARCEPGLLFLDVQLADGSGFELFDDELLEQLRTRAMRVIFVTAFEAFALRAFEVDALDYLLKPIDPARLRVAIERATGHADPQPAAGRLRYDDCLFLRLGSESVFLPVNRILSVTADGDYSWVATADGHHHMVLKPLKEWEARLPANAFARIHRSTIVNLRKVHRLESWFNHGYRVHVAGLGKPLTMSRRYRHRLSDRLG